MNLNLIYEDRDYILVDNMFNTRTINEGVMDIIDNAVEVVAGTIGFVPFAGDLADLTMVAKNLMQQDYLGAALFSIAAIPEPTDLTDLISKTLRVIQKVASATGQEDKVNEMIGWLAKKTGGNPIAATRQAWDMVDKKIKSTDQKTNVAMGKTNVAIDKTNNKEKKSIGVINRVVEFIKENWDAMTKALTEFLNLIQKKMDDLEKSEPTAGADNIPGYVDDLTNEYRSNYDKLLNAGGAKEAIEYKEQIRKEAKGDKAKEKAFKRAFMEKQNANASI
jgi:hypothetical protein